MKSVFAFLLLLLSTNAFAQTEPDDMAHLREDVVKATQAIVANYYPSAPLKYTRPIELKLEVGRDKKSLIDVVVFNALDSTNSYGCTIKIFFIYRYLTAQCDNKDRSRLMSMKATLNPDLSQFEVRGENLKFTLDARGAQPQVRKGSIALTRFTAKKDSRGNIGSYQVQKF